MIIYFDGQCFEVFIAKLFAKIIKRIGKIILQCVTHNQTSIQQIYTIYYNVFLFYIKFYGSMLFCVANI